MKRALAFVLLLACSKPQMTAEPVPSPDALTQLAAVFENGQPADAEGFGRMFDQTFTEDVQAYNGVFRTFRLAPSGTFEAVELRLPDDSQHVRRLLITPRERISRADAEARLGPGRARFPPSHRSEEVPLYLEYDRPWGTFHLRVENDVVALAIAATERP